MEERLTKKVENGFYELTKDNEIYGEENGIRLVQIVGQLEDIEDELGIDYITLNKLRKSDKIYVKFFKEIQEYTRFKIDLRECKILYGYTNGKGYGLKQPLSNYNKGFSLLKEVLKNE